ncbi:MAG: FKBP-type peptidyl-prolyl cis-trans isomerase [Spirochaetaceae bacterium]|jgi:FKBP-type peptidyl-prolyl cis-trans isomerase FkpA|nr:FKBP-type peptidyl-prolyl cis-trans isomerase [Spirochaetaceae bacterium]
MVKKTTIGFCLTLAVLTACNAKDGVDATNIVDADTSYAFGVLMGSDLKPFGLNFDYKAFAEGFKAYFEGKSKLTEDEAIEIVQKTINASMEREAAENLEAGEEFLEENALKNGIITTGSGLQYEIIKDAEGPKPNMDSTVRVNYEGTLIDGRVFDSSFERGEPVEFPLGQVIPGWTEGIQLMSPGSRYKFYIPSALGYGDQSVGNGLIPANSVLIFDVELLDILD